MRYIIRAMSNNVHLSYWFHKMQWKPVCEQYGMSTPVVLYSHLAIIL